MTLQEITQTAKDGTLRNIKDLKRSGLTPFCHPAMVLPKDLQVKPEEATGYNIDNNLLQSLGLPEGVKAYHVPIVNKQNGGHYNFYLIPIDGRCLVITVLDEKVSEVIPYLKSPDRKDMKRGFVKRLLKNTYSFFKAATDINFSNISIKEAEGTLVMICPVKAMPNTSLEKAILVKPSYILCNISCELRNFGWKLAMQTENALLAGKATLNFKQIKYFHLKYIGNYAINPAVGDKMKYLNEDIKEKIFENNRYELKLKMQCFPEEVEVEQRFDLCAFDEDLDATDIVQSYYIIHTPIGIKQWRCKLPYKGIGQLLASLKSITLTTRFPLLSKALRNSSEGKHEGTSVMVKDDVINVRCDYPDSYTREKEEKIISDLKNFILNIIIEITRYHEQQQLESERKSAQNWEYTSRMVWMRYLLQLL